MSLRRTPLHDVHERLGARLVDFAGYEMPVMYSSILEEHEAVRERVGLFDVSHMSNVWITGPDAVATLNRAFVADASKVPQGGTKYTCALREDGTILDDLYIFHVPRGFHVVPNAGKNEALVDHIRSAGDAEVTDATSEMCILALQGPKAEATLAAYTGHGFDHVKRFHLTQAPDLGEDAFVSRTGYTGEDGFEIFVPADRAAEVFEGLLQAGEAHGIRPCGLGARDTLRLEKGLALAGNEFAPPTVAGDTSAQGRTPLESRLGWLVNWDHDFIGKDALLAQKKRGDHPKLVGLKLTGRGIPRPGNEVTDTDGNVIGEVSSGSMSPMLKQGIALAYVPQAYTERDTELNVLVRGKAAPARVVKLPFL